MRTILVAATLAVSTLAGVDSGDAQSRGRLTPITAVNALSGRNGRACNSWPHLIYSTSEVPNSHSGARRRRLPKIKQDAVKWRNA